MAQNLHWFAVNPRPTQGPAAAGRIQVRLVKHLRQKEALRPWLNSRRLKTPAQRSWRLSNGNNSVPLAQPPSQCAHPQAQEAKCRRFRYRENLAANLAAAKISGM